MTPIIENLKLRNDAYVAQSGQQQQVSRAIIRRSGEIARTSPDFLLSASPTIDHSHFLCYLVEALELCPVEAPAEFSDVLKRCLKVAPAALPYLSSAIEGLWAELCVMDESLGSEAIHVLLNHLSDQEMVTLVSKGAKSESARQKKLQEVLIGTAFSNLLEAYCGTHRPHLFKSIPSATAMAIFRRHGWKAALEKSSGKAREQVFAEDLGL